jgi:hypothetical protein
MKHKFFDPAIAKIADVAARLGATMLCCTCCGKEQPANGGEFCYACGKKCAGPCDGDAGM